MPVVSPVIWLGCGVQEGAPHVDSDVWAMVKEQGLPVLGICYGMQEMAFSLGGRVAPGQKREYGKAMVHRNKVRRWWRSRSMVAAVSTNSVTVSHSRAGQTPLVVDMRWSFCVCAWAGVVGPLERGTGAVRGVARRVPDVDVPR